MTEEVWGLSAKEEAAARGKVSRERLKQLLYNMQKHLACSDAVPRSELVKAAQILTPQLFREIVYERGFNGLCGSPLCGRSPPSRFSERRGWREAARKQQTIARLPLLADPVEAASREKEVAWLTDVHDSWFCCPECQHAASAFHATMDDSPFSFRAQKVLRNTAASSRTPISSSPSISSSSTLISSSSTSISSSSSASTPIPPSPSSSSSTVASISAGIVIEDDDMDDISFEPREGEAKEKANEEEKGTHSLIQSESESESEGESSIPKCFACPNTEEDPFVFLMPCKCESRMLFCSRACRSMANSARTHQCKKHNRTKPRPVDPDEAFVVVASVVSSWTISSDAIDFLASFSFTPPPPSSRHLIPDPSTEPVEIDQEVLPASQFLTRSAGSTAQVRATLVKQALSAHLPALLALFRVPPESQEGVRTDMEGFLAFSDFSSPVSLLPLHWELLTTLLLDVLRLRHPVLQTCLSEDALSAFLESKKIDRAWYDAWRSYFKQ